MEENLIKNLSKKTIWEEKWFFDLFLKGISNDGLDKKIIQKIKEFLYETNPKSFENFIDTFKFRLFEEDDTQKEYIINFLDELAFKKNDNQNCYLRTTPSKTRVIQWPNNQEAKIKNPDHYFDIYKDNFYRKRYPFINKKTAIGSAGSCFASRIAHQLQKSGFNYVIEEDDMPNDFPIEDLVNSNFRTSPARVGTLFNVPSMRQMIERGFGYWDPEYIIAEDNGKLIDPFRACKTLYDDYQGFIDDYKRHSSLLKKALYKCDVFILTLGLTEAWYFAHSGKFTSISPHKINPILLRQKNLNVEENLAELEKLFHIYKKHKPNIKFIISVSPVPLNKTFSKNNHVVTSSCLSKSILRVAANKFCINHPDDVFYFPSYETVLYGCEKPWEKDQRHVSPSSVERVMELFANMFLEDKNEFIFSSINNQKEIQSTPLIRLKNLLRPYKRRILSIFTRIRS